ncbi:hypothetical protein AAC387_Pa05g1985 [Persea americana]
MFSRTSLLLRSTRRCLEPLQSQSILAKEQHSRAYIRSPFLHRKHGVSDVLSSSSSVSLLSSSSRKTGFVTWYLGMIEARPVITKAITAGAIFTCADVSSQMLTLMPSDSFDPIRTLRMAAFGMLFSGPSLHFWFNFISRILPKTDIFSTLKKMLMGQTIYGPIMNSSFFSVNASLQGETAAEIVARLKRDMLPTTISGLIYWPMCDFVTFKFIPVQLQPLVSNSFSFVWTIYITYMASLKKALPDRIATDLT